MEVSFTVARYRNSVHFLQPCRRVHPPPAAPCHPRREPCARLSTIRPQSNSSWRSTLFAQLESRSLHESLFTRLRAWLPSILPPPLRCFPCSLELFYAIPMTIKQATGLSCLLEICLLKDEIRSTTGAYVVLRSVRVQVSAKRRAPGCVNVVDKSWQKC